MIIPIIRLLQEMLRNSQPTGRPLNRYWRRKSRAEGLRSAEAAERLASFGPNALPEKKSKPAWLRFLAHFNDVLIFVLLAAARRR
jgi:magnesium-transporting ATPase (P-type)